MSCEAHESYEYPRDDTTTVVHANEADVLADGITRTAKHAARRGLRAEAHSLWYLLTH